MNASDSELDFQNHILVQNFDNKSTYGAKSVDLHILSKFEKKVMYHVALKNENFTSLQILNHVFQSESTFEAKRLQLVRF